MTGIVVLFYFIVGGGILSVIAGLIGLFFVDGKKTHFEPRHTEAETKVEVHVHQETPTQYPTIAEQFDGRLTNVFRNPLEGIL